MNKIMDYCMDKKDRIKFRMLMAAASLTLGALKLVNKPAVPSTTIIIEKYENELEQIKREFK